MSGGLKYLLVYLTQLVIQSGAMDLHNAFLADS
jgi:hypothetical protein